MYKSKPKKKSGTISTELLMRIDNMDDDKDYDPYQPLKRTTLSNDELFHSDDYVIQEDDLILKDGDKVKRDTMIRNILGITIAIVMITILIILGYVTYKFSASI